MLVAYFSPLNPVPSGISDYSEELLPHLAQYADIELIVDGYELGTVSEPSNPALKIFPQRALAEFCVRAPQYDIFLYHMGNSPAHAAIYETLLKYPGVVVMHDVVLHHLRAWLTLERGNQNEYRNAMREAYGEAGMCAAELEIQQRNATDRFEYSLNQDVVRAARGLIVHSAHAARELKTIAPETPLAIIPMGIPLPTEISQHAARQALHIAPDTFIVAAFGEIHPHKRILPTLAAFAEFHAAHPNSLCLLIGRTSPYLEIEQVARELNIQAAVRVMGFVPRATYEQYMAAADLCLNLRYPSAGETSASLLRLLAAGRVTFVTRVGASAELPDDVCVKIEPDAHEQALLVAYLEFFYAHPEARALLGTNARRYIQEHHTLEQAAQMYAEFLESFVVRQ